MKRSVPFFIRISSMDRKKRNCSPAGLSLSERQAFFRVPMEGSDCSLARSAPVLPACSGSRGTWTACLLSAGKQARQARCSLATILSAVTASTCSSSSLEPDALCCPASFRLPRALSACAGKGRRSSVVCCSCYRHSTSVAEEGATTTGSRWEHSRCTSRTRWLQKRIDPKQKCCKDEAWQGFS